MRNRVNPSRNSVPECKTPWPRPTPAKCLLLLGYYVRCRTITRDSKTVQRATHALDGLSVISPSGPERKGKLTKSMLVSSLLGFVESKLMFIHHRQGRTWVSFCDRRRFCRVWALHVLDGFPLLGLWVAFFRFFGAGDCRVGECRIKEDCGRE